MILKTLFLQNFRNYIKSEFIFNRNINVVAGANAAGKTNLLEAVFLLSTGRSFKAENYDQMIRFSEQFSSVKGVTGLNADINEDMDLQIIINHEQNFASKKFSVNGVAKRRASFAGKFSTVLFLPTDLDIVIGSPSARRRFLDDVLEQTDSEYSSAINIYTKALRQRNALLGQAREQGVRDPKVFIYWDNLLITHGQIIARKREEFLSFINKRKKELFGFEVVYDKSEISAERLKRYKIAEMGAGVTLVGPHRDDLQFQISNFKCQNEKGMDSPQGCYPFHGVARLPPSHKATEGQSRGNDKGMEEGLAARQFASRGQQRLVVLELKLAQIAYTEKQTGERPMLLLDDIFSELDNIYIGHILKILPDYQTITTTTHKEFVEGLPLGQGNVIELDK